MVKINKRLLSGVIALGFLSVAQAQQELRIRLASYNVENLFDSIHDEDPELPNGKEDIAFLPLANPLKRLCPEISSGFYLKQCQETDWTLERATWKLNNAAKALSYISKKPDIIALAEVENKNVVGALARKLGYGTGHLTSNSPDHRGIDVGVIYNKSKLKIAASKEIEVVGENMTKPTRNILRIEFKLKGSNGRVLADQSLFVYANHWPSQAAPSATRMMTAKILQEDIESVRASVRGTPYFVVMGDFNTIPRDMPHPFNDLILNQEVWTGALVDAEEYSREKVPALNDTLLPGSYWFGRDSAWNKLDHIFVSQNLADERGADLVPSTFFILKDERIMKNIVPTHGPFAGESVLIPQRFETTAPTQAEMGYSDHLPIGVEIKIPASAQ
ncbi:MAG: endonuclease/exonuclease/phosphatase family protein [Bdellovibrionota bacterium]